MPQSLAGQLDVFQNVSSASEAVTSLTVFCTTLANLPDITVDPSTLATNCRFRLVDVSAFLDAEELRIVEYTAPIEPHTDISHVAGVPPYVALSYPWRDLQDHAVLPSISVAGAQHADPISISVLRTACTAARAYGYSMLWLDRLCILQSQKQDKSWQIQRMFRVYKSCALCIVLPGGLVRLARLDDSTSWIYRAWTLQEAVAPGMAKLKLVFQLSHPSYQNFIDDRCAVERYPEAYSSYLSKHAAAEVIKCSHGSFVDQVLEEGTSAAANMDKLLLSLWSMDSSMRQYAPEIARTHTKFPIRILPAPEAYMMSLAIDLRGSRLWIAAYTRSSSRPVDMIFSLMDLLGVQVDVKQFGENDRLQATIAMLQALMRHPKATASWLFIAPEMTPSRELSTLPQMPETSESGQAYINTPSKGRVLAYEAVGAGGTNFWRSDGAPTGKMTDSGYFEFWARAAPMVNVDGYALRKSLQKAASSSEAFDDREIWAVVIGRFKNFNRNPDTWRMQSWNPDKAPRPKGLFELTLMLVEKHGYGRYHRIGMEREIDERKTNEWRWTYRRFHVGGPGKGERKRFTVGHVGPEFTNRDEPEEDHMILRID